MSFSELGRNLFYLVSFANNFNIPSIGFANSSRLKGKGLYSCTILQICVSDNLIFSGELFAKVL